MGVLESRTDRYYKVEQLSLQSEAGITNCGSYYEVAQLLQSGAVQQWLLSIYSFGTGNN